LAGTTVVNHRPHLQGLGPGADRVAEGELMTHDRPPRQPALHGLVDVSHQPSAVESFVINFRPAEGEEAGGKLSVKSFLGRSSRSGGKIKVFCWSRRPRAASFQPSEAVSTVLRIAHATSEEV